MATNDTSIAPPSSFRDGVLAVDRAMDRESLVMRREYERNREFFDARVDYAIVPTI